MEFLNSDLVIPIGLGVAVVLLLLFGRGRGPRRIGMDGGGERSGAVSRTSRSPDRKIRTQKQHTRHDDDWRTNSAGESKTPAVKPSSAKPADAMSLHERLQAYAKAKQAGEEVDPRELLSIAVTSKDARKAAPGVFRVAFIAIWVWLALWGFAMVMSIGSVIENGSAGGGVIAILFSAVPVALGIAGLRIVRKFKKRVERQMAEAER